MLQKFDERNKDLHIWVGDRLYHRNEAKVSVFDSVVQGGDAVWEGLRIYPEGVMMLDRHLNRMYESAKALAFTHIPPTTFIKDALRQTLEANRMDRDTHVRVTLTRGSKITSGMDPRLNQSGSTLIILPEWKPPVYDNDHGIKVITSTIRRNNPAFLDSKIHHNNLLNNIQAKIQANVAGVDAALMLDKDAFAAELNGTNIFMAKGDRVYTPYATACLHGMTRGLIIELCQLHGIHIEERNLSLTELYNADELFCSGTMGELTPITELDGRLIENRNGKEVMKKLISYFEKAIPEYCTRL